MPKVQTTQAGELVLPRWAPFEKSVHPPHRNHIEAEHALINAYGVKTRVRLHSNWPRTRWFVTAVRNPDHSLGATRASNGLATGSRTKAAKWESAIRAGRIRIEE